MRRLVAVLGAGVVLSGGRTVTAGPEPAGDGGAAGARRVNATGSFEVKLAPAADDAGTGLGRMTLEKTYHGQLEGTARGEMLTAMGGVKESGAYVAVERFTGTLLGRRGSFSLVHRGVMSKGRQELSIAVVPDSGTEALKGLAGTLGIRIEPGGKHFYLFEGTLPDR